MTPPAPPPLRIARRYSYVLPFRSLLIGEPPRPYTPVWLEYAGQRIFTNGLIDSGADGALFNAAYASYLGIDVEAGAHARAHGVGSGAIDVWRHELFLIVLGKRFAASVDFAHDWGPEFGLLGMRDLFHHFAIAFEERDQQVLLQPLA